MSQEVFKLVGFQFGATWIPISGGEVTSQVTPFLMGTGSSVAPTLAGLQSSRPIVRIVTPALGTALAALGIRGAVIATTASVYLAKVDPISYTAGSVHQVITVNDGMVALRTITASADSPAMATFEVYATYDGTNLPFAVTSGTAPADTALSELYYLGPASIDGTPYEVQSVTYNSGIAVMHDIHSGLPFPTFAGIMAEEPEIDITTLDANACVPFGEPVDGSFISFRKAKEASPGREANTEEAHIKLTMNKAFAYTADQSGDWRDAVNNRVVLRPRKDGANAVVTLATASAI